MTDKKLESLLNDNMPLLDLPESLSANNITNRLENVTQIRKAPLISSKNISIAASFILIAVGIMSFIVTNREQKADIGISNDMQQSSGLYFQDEEIVQEEAIIEYKAEYSDSIEAETDNSYMMPAADTGSASIIYDKELELIIGEEERVLIDSNFGKNAEICYYDLQGNIINKDVLKTELISSENGICLKLVAVKPGTFTIELLNEDYVYRIKVVISEE